jgi:hypothetical protein
MQTKRLLTNIRKGLKPNPLSLHKVIHYVYSEDYKPASQGEVYGAAHGRKGFGIGRDMCFAFLEAKGILFTDESELVQRAI